MALICPWECCCAHITHYLQFLMHPIILEYFIYWKNSARGCTHWGKDNIHPEILAYICSSDHQIKYFKFCLTLNVAP